MPWFKVLDGVNLPMHFKEENYYKMKDLLFRDGDVILCTYPKCGTNWTAYMLWGIFHPSEEPPEGTRVLSEDVPFVEGFGLGRWEGVQDKARTLCTHLAPGKLTISPKAKYVVVVRNPFDCCVSFFHFAKFLGFSDISSENIIPDSFVEAFLKGDVVYGKLFEYLLEWYRLRNEPNVYLVSYEEFIDDPRGEILKLATFLGQEQELIKDEEKLLNKIVNQTSFSFMKKNVNYSMKDGTGNSVSIPMLRKGQVAGFRDELSEKQVQKIRSKMEDSLAGTTLLLAWKNL